MFEQTFKNIDNILHKDAGCGSELDYVEQTSWGLILQKRFRASYRKHRVFPCANDDAPLGQVGCLVIHRAMPYDIDDAPLGRIAEVR